MVGARGGDRGLVFNRDRVSVWEDENGSRDGWWWRLPYNANVLNVTELFS